MRARPEIRPHLIAHRMKRWLDIARCPLMNIRVPTWKARRNYRALVRRYPEIASALGYSEALSYPSPLHGLAPSKLPSQDGSLPAQEDKPPEPPESPPAADNSVPGQTPDNQPARLPAVTRHLWALEDEVL